VLQRCLLNTEHPVQPIFQLKNSHRGEYYRRKELDQKSLEKIFSDSHFCKEKWHRYSGETQRKKKGTSSDLSI